MHWVYILTNKSNSTLFIGVTRNLRRCLSRDLHTGNSELIHKFNLRRLVYFEQCDSAVAAIQREKQIKQWHRKKLENLIEGTNPRWQELTLGSLPQRKHNGSF